MATLTSVFADFDFVFLPTLARDEEPREELMANDLPKLGADFEIWGHWWLPAYKSDQVTGCLTSRGGNLQLKLLGQFNAIDVNHLHLSVPVIHGVADGKLFTLWNAIQGSFGFKAPGTIEQHFQSMRILAGGHLSERSKVRFTALSLYASNLGPWSNLRPVDYSFSAEDPSDISYRMAKNRSTEIVLSNFGMTLKIGTSWSTRNKEFDSYGFDVLPSLRAEFSSPELFDDVIERLGSLQRIFSLLVGMELVAEKATVEIDGGRKLDNIFGLLVEHAPPEDEEILPVYKVLAPFPILKDRASEIFSHWFDEESRLKDATDLLIRTIRRTGLPTPIELTSLAQALETFHRNIHGEGFMTAKEYKPIKKAIMDWVSKNMSEELSNSISERIGHANEHTFQARMRMLLGKFSDELLKALGIDRNTFPSAVSKARNEFTHWDAKTSDARSVGADLSNLVSKLKAFTRLVLLSHLGVSPDTVVKRMTENMHLYLPEWVKINHS